MRSIKLFYKRAPKSARVIVTLLNIGNLIAGAWLIWDILQFGEINLVRTIAMIAAGVLVLINLIIFLIGINIGLRRKKTGLIIYAIALLTLIGGQIYVSEFHIDRIYDNLAAITETGYLQGIELTVLVDSEITSVEDLNEKTIGVINFESEQAKNTRAMVEELELAINNDLEEYDDFIAIAYDLINEEIDAAIFPSGFEELFGEDDALGDLEEKFTSIYSKTFATETDLQTGRDIDEPFTVLILGIDAVEEDLSQARSLNADSIMLLTFNPNTLNTTMMSIPRDTFVPVMCIAGQRQNKIAHTGVGGAQCMIDTIENFTGIEIDYFVRINMVGMVRIVDALGGIEVDVPIEFCEQDSQRRRGRHEICLEKGVQTLDGEGALALARHRRTINDFIRGYNNQLVLSAMVNTATEIRNPATISQIIDTVSDSMQTNMTTGQILSLANFFHETMGSASFSPDRLFLSGQGRMIFDPVFRLTLYNFVLYEGSVDDVVNAMKTNLELREPEMIRNFSFDIREPFVAPEIGRGNYTTLMGVDAQAVVALPNFIGRDRAFITSWANRHGLRINFATAPTTNANQANRAIRQSVSAGTDINRIRSLTITMGSFTPPANNNTNNPPNNENTTSEPDPPLETVLPEEV